jgi:hypothetical protein
MDTYSVSREADVGADADQVRAALVDFKEWRHWSPWEGLDPALQRTYSGPDSGVGATYHWQGNRKAGEGRMEVTSVTPEEVVIALDFVKPFKSSTTSTFRLQPQEDGTTHVSWTLVGPKTMGTKIMGIFTSMDKLVGKDFEKGLRQLDGYVRS